MGYSELRLLLLVVAIVLVAYVLGRRLRSPGSGRASSAPRDPTATIRQLARVGDVDGLRHFLTSKSSSDQIRAAAEQELTSLASGTDQVLACRALVGLGAGLTSLTPDRRQEIVDRIIAELRKDAPAVLAWLTSAPRLDPAGPLVASLSTLRKDEAASPTTRVAASAALLGAGVLGARAGAFMAAYRRQIDVEEQEDDDMGGGTALFSDPLDEPCAVISPEFNAPEEILLSTSGRVLVRRKVADERISEASEGAPARVERRWEISPPSPDRLSHVLAPCAGAIAAVLSDEPKSA